MGLSRKIEELSPQLAKKKMARYSLNFGNKWEVKVVMGKEYGFTSIFDIPKKFARRKMELARKKARAKILPHL